MGISRAWWTYAAAAAALALVVLWNWIWAVAIRGPILYGEGAVAHAAILARTGAEYANPLFSLDADPIFTAANYPPLYFHLVAIGEDPFVTGRVLSVVATLFVAVVIAWRARPAGTVVAATLALAWIASTPVMQWGAAVKPDPVALAFTVGAVIALARDRPNHALVFLVTYRPDEAMRLHVIEWNALPWRPELLIGLAVVALLVLAVPIGTVARTRSHGGVVGAYLAGAVGVVLLGGREGATINYFLDLSAALALTAAGIAPRLALGIAYPLTSLAQLAFAAALLNPFPSFPSLLEPTGKWGYSERISYVRDYAAGTVLVEDSGLVVANGREPQVDDLFLWSRLYGSGRIEGVALLDAVRAGKFDAVVTEVDLERFDLSPGYERQRWHPDLVAAVLDRYHMPTRYEGLCRSVFVYCQRLYVYTRR